MFAPLTSLRSRHAHFSRSFMSAAFLVAGALLALSPAARANVVGSDMQNFNATTSGLDFVTVQSSETLKPGIVNLGLFFNYAVNTLPYFEATSTQSKTNFNDTVLGADLNAGLGLTRNWDMGISFPQILNQTVQDQNGARGEFSQTGSTEVRLNTKYRFYGDDSGGIAGIASIGMNRIQDNPWVGRDGGPSVNLEIAADTTVGRIAYGGNVGYRIRNPGTRIPNSQVAPLKDQGIASAAISYHVPDWNTKFIGELYGSFPTSNSSSNSDRSLSSAEILGGVKHDLTENLALHAGLNYTFGPLWGQNDLSDPPIPPQKHMVQIIPREPAPQPAVERYRTQKILFVFDSDRMIGNFQDVLDELVQHLSSGFRELVVEGHTDSIGPALYNEKLSLRRANAIRYYLVTKYGMDARKIMTIGFGMRRPIADNGNYQGRQQNRRVEFEIKR
jgi:outer membrane protein OmpA-like peptidoglycan-associated protein